MPELSFWNVVAWKKVPNQTKMKACLTLQPSISRIHQIPILGEIGE